MTTSTRGERLPGVIKPCVSIYTTSELSLFPFAPASDAVVPFCVYGGFFFWRRGGVLDYA